MTKSQVNKLGKLIRRELRESENPSESLLDNLQIYRTSFKNDLSEVFEKISDIAKSVRKDSIISFRIKRIESILSKIRRQPTMALGNMGDIAGCRILVYHASSLQKVIALLHLSFNVKDVNDYLKEIKEDGYRGYHLYIESPINKDKLIEIQVRTVESHKWSSMVEIIDMIYDTKIKEGQKHPDFQKFLLLLSDKSNLGIPQKQEMIGIDNKHSLHSKLNEVFIKNHVKIRKDWLTISPNQNPYFIIEVDSNKTSNIYSYSNYETAEKVYFEKFKENNESYFVLTHLEKPNFNRLCLAYASYVLIKHDYMNDWSKFTSDLIEYFIEKEDYNNIKFYRNYIQRNLTLQLDLLSNDFKEMEDYKNQNTLDYSEYEEWFDELKTRLGEIKKIVTERQNDKKRSFWSKMLGE
jgi:ppGpp synthetase/RelA/SpoT-type nucleotidyltranferase